MSTEVKQLILNIKAKGAKVLVVGLGKSGVASVEYLAGLGISVCGVDKKPRAEFLPEHLKILDAKALSLFFEDRIEADLKSFDLLVVSPGVPLDGPIVGEALKVGIPIISEMELGIEMSGLPYIVVTGSNGKSTTVSLVHSLLVGQNIKSILCGNIGTPILEALRGLGNRSENAPELLVVEASSYQLESVTKINPAVGVFLNLSENHLERHGSLEKYGAAKLKLFERQDKKAFAVLNVDDAFIKSHLDSIPSNICAISANADNEELGAQYALVSFDPARELDEIKISMGDVKETFSLQSCPLLGIHNRFNVAAALLALYAWSEKSGHKLDSAALVKSIATFRTLTHRIEPLIIAPDLIVINDSKSTTVASSVVALDTIAAEFPKRKIRLLLGGKSKKGSWAPLAKKALERSNSVKIYCFGADGGAVSQELHKQGLVSIVCPTMREAVNLACDELEASDVLLFSPGCASFDEFSDFEARGNVFRSIICRRYPNSSPSLHTELLAS